MPRARPMTPSSAAAPSSPPPRPSPADVGIVAASTITAIGADLAGGRARDRRARPLVLPGGIDSHCHIEQLSSAGARVRGRLPLGHGVGGLRRHDDGVPFAAQHRGMKLRDVVEDYHRAGDREGGDRLRLPPDPRRSDRGGARRGPAAPGRAGDRLAQGLHDLRSPAARRRAAPRRAGRRTPASAPHGRACTPRTTA